MKKPSRIKQKKQHKQSYLETFKEYQDKQYLPGYFLGGKLPPVFLARTKIEGVFLIVAGIFYIVFSTLFFFTTKSQNSIDQISRMLAFFIFIAASLLAIIAGIKSLKENKKT